MNLNDTIINLKQLVMLLEPVPVFNITLPENYFIRNFMDGDEPAWENIVLNSFGYECDFNKTMRGDACFKNENVFFVCFGETPVGTASAWEVGYWSDALGDGTGYLHMVAVLPEHRGKKLGYAVSAAAVNEMAKRGDHRAVLQTDEFRKSAIKTYFEMGFAPFIVNEFNRAGWDKK